MKKFIYSLSLFLALAACATPEAKIESDVHQDVQVNKLPLEFVTAFKASSIETCNRSGNNLDECSCYANEIIDTFTVDDFTIVHNFVENNNMENIISDPQVGHKIINASVKCFSN